MRTFLISLLAAVFMGSAVNAASDIRAIDAKVINGQLGFRNLVKNPNCRLNVVDITGSSVAAVKNTTNALDDISDCTWDPSAASQTLTFSFDNLPPKLKGQNCEARLSYKGDASLLTAQVYINSIPVSNIVTLTNTGTNSDVKSLNYPCGDGTTATTAVLTSTGNAANVQYSLYGGEATNLASGIDTGVTTWTPTGSWSTNTTYTGKRQITNRGTVVYDVLVTTSGAPTATTLEINLPPGDVIDTTRLINSTANNYNLDGTVVAFDNGGSAYALGSLRYSSTTSFSVGTQNASGTYGTYTSITQAVPFTFGASDTVNVHVELPIVGIASQSAIRADQTDFGWTSYSPTPSAGFGTTSNMAATYMRRGDSLFIKARFTTGTVAASSASVPLPTGLVIDSTKTPSNEHIVGYYANGNKASGKGQVLVDVSSSTTVLYFGPNEGSTSNLAANTGSNVSASTQGFNFFAGPIPIVGWTNSQAAQILVGGITSSSTFSLRDEAAYITNSGSCAVSSQNGGDWISSVADPGVGRCTINFKAGYFTTAPVCTCTAILSSTADTCFVFSAATTSSVLIYTRDNSGATGANADGDFYINCKGPR